MDFKQVIEKRRRCRRFLEKVPSREVLQQIVDATLTAPSSRNMRTTRLVVVTDTAKIKALATLRDYGSAFMEGATAAIVVAADAEGCDLWRENCSISATILQLAAVDAGLSSCWVHVDGRPRLREQPEGEQAVDYVREVLSLPATWEVECIIALGYTDYTPKPLPEFDKTAVVEWQ